MESTGKENKEIFKIKQKGTIKLKYKKGEVTLDKLVLVDGNSIMNRAFYGIMGSKMLTTKDGKYTNAVYGFLAILFNFISLLF